MRLFFSVLLLVCLLLRVIDNSVILCMEQDCQYLQNSSGELVLHPKTGEPVQNCKVTKSDYVVAMETIERITKYVLPSATEATASNSTEIQPKKL
jgi:hypothetical protein